MNCFWTFHHSVIAIWKTLISDHALLLLQTESIIFSRYGDILKCLSCKENFVMSYDTFLPAISLERYNGISCGCRLDMAAWGRLCGLLSHSSWRWLKHRLGTTFVFMSMYEGCKQQQIKIIFFKNALLHLSLYNMQQQECHFIVNFDINWVDFVTCICLAIEMRLISDSSKC